MRVNLYLDEESQRCIGELPRKVNASRIVRYVLKAIVTTDEEWAEILKTDKDAQTVHAYLREKLLRRIE